MANEAKKTPNPFTTSGMSEKNGVLYFNNISFEDVYRVNIVGDPVELVIRYNLTERDGSEHSFDEHLKITHPFLPGTNPEKNIKHEGDLESFIRESLKRMSHKKLIREVPLNNIEREVVEDYVNPQLKTYGSFRLVRYIINIDAPYGSDLYLEWVKKHMPFGLRYQEDGTFRVMRKHRTERWDNPITAVVATIWWRTPVKFTNSDVTYRDYYMSPQKLFMDWGLDKIVTREEVEMTLLEFAKEKFLASPPPPMVKRPHVTPEYLEETVKVTSGYEALDDGSRFCFRCIFNDYKG